MNTLELKRIVDDIKEKGYGPSLTFKAKAGKNYGYADLFEIYDKNFGECCIVEFGDEFETNYEIIREKGFDPEELGYYVEVLKDTEGDINDIVHLANIWGIDSVQSAEAIESDEGPFYILKTEYLMDYLTSEEIETTDLIRYPFSKEPISFDSYEAAEDCLIKIKNKHEPCDYEIDSPTYKIIDELRAKRLLIFHF